MKHLILTALGMISLCAIYSQPNISFSDFEYEIKKNISVFTTTVRRVANCNTPDETRKRAFAYTKNIFEEDAIIEVLPSPGRPIIACKVEDYFRRVFNYCNKYDLAIIKFNTLIQPREFKQIIYKGQVAYSVKALIRQCTSFYEVTSKKKEVPDAVLVKPTECTDKLIDVIIYEKRTFRGQGYDIKFKSIKVVDGQYLKD